MSLSILQTLSAHLGAAFAAMDLPAEYGRVTESDKSAPFQCNGALAAAKLAKKSPRDIASFVVVQLDGNPDIALAEIAGPGFINLTPSAALVAQRVKELAGDPRTGVRDADKPAKIVIDYGGANVAKPMHVGHLRSAVIGESLKRILRARGHEVIGDVHLGDWGLQMGHLISELEEEQPDLVYFDAAITDGYPKDSPVTMDDMARLYPQASTKSKADPARLKKSQTATAELQSGRPGYRALLDHFIRISIEYLKKGYGDLGVTFDLWKGEASVDPLIPDMIEAMTAQGITQKSDGALIIPVDDNYDAETRKGTPPVMLRARTGAVLYHTTDLATLLDRKNAINPDHILYVVDQRQATHFEQVFRAAALAGWYKREQLEHLGFGTVNGPDGKPFTTRDGGVLRLSDLTKMMRDAAAKRLEKSGIGQDFGAAERADIANKVGMAALKFADLQNQRTTNYIFDIDRFVSFEGKTGPYLLYAAVRIKSLLRKAKDKGVEPGDILPLEKAEQNLVLMLDSFNRALAAAEAKRMPHILCDHVYTLAQAFSKFYADCPVLADDVADDIKSSRLALAALTLKQLEAGLALLGIETPERM
ncbi:MAG: arginine--tRNA ligase [Robiginitomaculum sp.]|nr:arginine--tRNA ligase [Robiginitomaculum sp.]